MTEPTKTAALDADLATIARINAIPSILEIATRITGLRFAAVARVTESKWMACAVRDELSFGLKPGGELDLKTTICDEVRDAGAGIIIDHVANDDRFRDHHTPKTYGFESYISIPIFRRGGAFFGTLCALDPLPAQLSNPAIVATFENFARLIGLQLDAQEDLMHHEAALAEAAHTTEIRERFIAILGHDLRNPIAAIDAGATILERMKLGSRADDILGRMRQSSRRMARLVGDLLDFARGRLGSGLTLDSALVTSLAGPIEAVVAELQMVHPDRRIELEFALTEPVTCDVDRITQLLSNLLANALTHGAPDTPVTVAAMSADGVFTLAVTNAGPTIPAATLATLFRPFVRVASGHGQDGLGLGLFIANEIAKAHLGRIDVSSAGGMTRFSLTMPCSLPEDMPTSTHLAAAGT